MPFTPVKSMVSTPELLAASIIACLNEPAPLSLLLLPVRPFLRELEEFYSGVKD
ncbi:hypothetical protein [Aphanizomenon sp. UHCC 0183]|uniref:hypothetical protein n=1 Tax=Aphanizomenon sp. UHCC 0183 TaxID=2590028 RepID=UPI0014462061|nr:hypothetical protein [Aphanizomenon sp. UHCC 0183]